MVKPNNQKGEHIADRSPCTFCLRLHYTQSLKPISFFFFFKNPQRKKPRKPSNASFQIKRRRFVSVYSCFRRDRTIVEMGMGLVLMGCHGLLKRRTTVMEKIARRWIVGNGFRSGEAIHRWDFMGNH